MSLSLKSIKDRGDLNSERAVFVADSELDVGLYLLLCTGFRDEMPTAGVKHAFWFPDQEVKKGDLVVVYSKRGKRSRKENPSGAASYFFYWGLEESIWGGDMSAAVLVEADSWKAKLPKDF